MKIGVLTSSRADYGIYRPLLKYWKNDSEISFELIVFGQHLMNSFGKTLHEIENDGFEVKHQVFSEYPNDSPYGIALHYANTSCEFASFWNEHKFDWVMALGDRYEMSAAVQSGIPYQVRFAHIHAGERTLGAIDEIYRHQISLASSIHFVSIKQYAKRIQEITQLNDSSTIVGALSLENKNHFELLDTHYFVSEWGINLDKPTLFFIVHPETKELDSNPLNAQILSTVCSKLCNDFQLLISLPNSDTYGNIYRQMWYDLKEKNNQIFLIENFGTQAFFSCLKHVKLVIGNSSSAIIEAASFKKFVLNLGNRQKGRITSKNVIHLPFDKTKIIEHVKKYANQEFNGENIYERPDGLRLITEKLKQSIV